MIVNIRGTNGSGKTTLVSSFLDEFSTVEDIELPSGKHTKLNISADERFVVVGPYDGKKTGGCDRISTVADTQAAVDEAGLRGNIVLFEGIIVSTVYSTWLEYSKRQEYPFIWVYLTTPLSMCLNRICDRNGFKQIKEDLVADKYRCIARTMDKAIADGEVVLQLRPDDPATHLEEYLCHA